MVKLMFRDSIFSKLTISCFELEKALVFLFNQAFPVIKDWLNCVSGCKIFFAATGKMAWLGKPNLSND